MKGRSLLGFDVVLLLSALSLSAIGVLFVYSSGVSSTGVVLSKEYIKQIIWVSLGVAILFGVVAFDYRRLSDLSPYIYAGVLLLLVLTLFVGRVVNGARSWIPIFQFGFQPSEFAKIVTILYLARYFDSTASRPASLVRFGTGAAIIFVPMLLILLQPDMGTALVYVPIFLFMSFVARCKIRYIAFFFATGVLLVFFLVVPVWQSYVTSRDVGFVYLFADLSYGVYALGSLVTIAGLSALGYIFLKRQYFYWISYGAAILSGALGGSYAMRSVLKEFQMLRLIVFLDPMIDPRGAGWNVIQSVTAVGSGGLLGKGWLKGTQSHYRFLPQQSTDFIFSIIAEEWGFVGSMAVFVLFALLLFRGLMIMMNAADRYGALISAGIVGMIFFHVFINVGMAMGIMPITGIPLFFLSYGGSSLWTALIGIGLLLSIHMRRYRY